MICFFRAYIILEGMLILEEISLRYLKKISDFFVYKLFLTIGPPSIFGATTLAVFATDHCCPSDSTPMRMQPPIGTRQFAP